MATFAAARALCCPAPVPLSTPSATRECRFDEALEGIGSAVKTRDDAAVDQALSAYVRAASCLVRKGDALKFAAQAAPDRTSAAFFQRIRDRARDLAESVARR